MRIFISAIDDSGQKRNSRLNIANFSNTTLLIKQICKQLGVNRSNVIIKLKWDPQNLRLVDNWPTIQYPIKNGSTFIVQFNQKINCSEGSASSTEHLQKIEENADDSMSQNSNNSDLSFISEKGEHDESKYLDEELQKMLEAVREGKLENIAMIIKQEPKVEDEKEIERIMLIKQSFLLNQVGQCGRNALHWAIHQRNSDIVSFLLIKGANPTILTIDQYTCLQLAVQHKSAQIIRLLLEQKTVDVNRVTKHGTALHLAVRNQDFHIVELLLQNGADPEIIDFDEKKKPVDICKNQKIKNLFIKKSKEVKVKIPNITKGNAFKVTSFTYRNKEKVMLLNPFKNQLTLSLQNQPEESYRISKITNIFSISDKSWLMKSDLFYFRIELEQKQILLAFRYKQIFEKWIENIKDSRKYVQNADYNRVVPSEEQIIQMLDDQKNMIKLHKRKVKLQNLPVRNTLSIMSLPVQKYAKIQEKQQKMKLEKTRKLSENSDGQSSEFKLRQSELLLGSVIDLQKTNSSSIILSNSAPSKIYEKIERMEMMPEIILEPVQIGRFRKKSEPNVIISKISEFTTESENQKIMTVSFNDFEIVRMLGNGAFGKVYLAKHKKSKKVYALKVLNKKKLVAKKQIKYAAGEANILKKLNCPFIVKLYYAFQTPSNLYMALDHCPNGDLSELITLKERLSESTARFIIAQVITAVEYLHQLKILYRDLKPENILIAKDGYVCLTDFGLSRQNNFSMSFCGSPAYLSPEMLEKKGVGFSSDIYGIGCVLFEMLIGEPPFFDQNLDLLFENIKAGKLRFPGHVTREARSLILKLLQKDIKKRIGVNNMEELKSHEFFKGFDWKKLQRKVYQAPSEMDVNQLDFDLVDLQPKQSTERLIDIDYENQNSIINRIKNFTFIRQQDEKSEKQEIEDYKVEKSKLKKSAG